MLPADAVETVNPAVLAGGLLAPAELGVVLFAQPAMATVTNAAIDTSPSERTLPFHIDPIRASLERGVPGHTDGVRHRIARRL
jgi:hypothetical protein